MATKNTKKKNSSKPTSQYKQNIGRLVGKSLFVLVAMAWAFILGVLVGKGYRPENAIPEIARIMPDTQEVPPEKPRVLKAEELGYYDRLKKTKSQPDHTQARTTQPAPPVKADASPAKAQPEQRFAYIFQAAAFRSQTDAFRFQQQIIGMGIPAFVEDAPSGWHRVNVRFKGTASESEHLKTQLKSIGVTKPLLKSRTPV